MPYFCYIHNGLYVSEEGKDGCQHETCRAFRELDIPGRIVVGVGETHSEYWKKVKHEKFNKDMVAYREARRNGLKPERYLSKQSKRLRGSRT